MKSFNAKVTLTLIALAIGTKCCYIPTAEDVNESPYEYTLPRLSYEQMPENVDWGNMNGINYLSQ